MFQGPDVIIYQYCETYSGEFNIQLLFKINLIFAYFWEYLSSIVFVLISKVIELFIFDFNTQTSQQMD